MVEKDGRTWDATSNPGRTIHLKPYQIKRNLKKNWKDEPGWMFANVTHTAYHDREHLEARWKQFDLEIKV